MTITKLLQQIHAGEKDAFAQIVTMFQAPLFSFLGRMGLNQAQSEELAQETFLRAWTRLEHYQPRLGAFSTWLFTIARNLALNECSRAGNRRETAWTEIETEPVCSRPQPEEALIGDRRRQQLRLALLRLSPDNRCVLALAYTRGLNITEIAQIESSTPGAIKTRLHRAREQLRRYLENPDE
jgi:RNA polymerase sigma-70 factor (ECF subfamily)